MTLPAMGPMATETYRQLLPNVRDDQQRGGQFANYIAAMLAPSEFVETYARDQPDGRTGYSLLLNLDEAPVVALPWLAQFKGVVIPGGMPSGRWREWVRSAEGQHRGTDPALIAAGQRHLTGAQQVRVLSRTGPTAYHMTVITRTSETPDPDVTLADFMSAKRIGILLTHIVSDEPVIDEGTRTIDAAGGTIDAATLADIT